MYSDYMTSHYILHDIAFEVPCWGEETLLQLACEIEGHPDNVAPAIYGGIQVGLWYITLHCAT